MEIRFYLKTNGRRVIQKGGENGDVTYDMYSLQELETIRNQITVNAILWGYIEEIDCC